MELLIYCFITLIVLGAADPNPQTGISSSLASVPKFGDRLKTPELTLYLTQDVMKALQNVNLSKNPVTSIETPDQNIHIKGENYNQEGQKIYAQQSHPKKSYPRNRGFVSRFFLPRDKEVIEHQEKNDLAKFYEDSLKIQKDIYKQLQNSQQSNAYNEEGRIQINANSLPYIPVTYTSQEKLLLQEQLKQQWNHILDHKRAQLQGLSAIRDHNHVQLQGLSPSRHQNDHNNQIPPILIHSEVRITKHLPVPVYKLVDIPKPSS